MMDYATMVAESMKRPEHAGFWDDRMHNTHGPMFFWANRTDDLIAESNYYTILSDFEGIDSDDWFTASLGHWAVGNLESVWVRWYDDNGEPTEAGLKAFELVECIQDYAILDESDYSEREWKKLEDEYDWSVGQLEWNDREFTDRDTEIVLERVRENYFYDIQDYDGIDTENLQDILDTVVDDFLDEFRISTLENDRDEQDNFYYEVIR